MDQQDRTWRKPLQVLCDTNIVISMFINRGDCQTNIGEISRQAEKGMVALFLAKYSLEEGRRKVSRKWQEYIADFEKLASRFGIVDVPWNSAVLLEAKRLIGNRDSKDVNVLATALRFAPDFFCTGDKDFGLLPVRAALARKECRLVTPRELAERLRELQRDRGEPEESGR
ncbi:MAG: PIN domain-containing protein [Thermaerobacter sp.]|nr:PIN domain-containing protein [Thermaerobacter sp.]